MARPERFELPTARFVEVEVENKPNRNSKLDGPPSPLGPLRTVETRKVSANRYDLATLAAIRRRQVLTSTSHLV